MLQPTQAVHVSLNFVTSVVLREVKQSGSQQPKRQGAWFLTNHSRLRQQLIQRLSDGDRRQRNNSQVNYNRQLVPLHDAARINNRTPTGSYRTQTMAYCCRDYYMELLSLLPSLSDTGFVGRRVVRTEVSLTALHSTCQLNRLYPSRIQVQPQKRSSSFSVNSIRPNNAVNTA